MAVTLVEAAKIALGKNQIFEASIIELFAKNSDLLATLPFDTIQGNAYKFNREKILPNVAFRALNAAYTESTGKVDQITESLYVAGGDIDVDKFIIDTSGMGQRAVQEAMKVKALTLSLTKALIKGDNATDPNSITGLQARIPTTDGQALSNGVSILTGLSLTKLDELIDMVDEPTHLIMNKTLRRRLSVAARTAAVGGNIVWKLGEFGRQVMHYNDLPVLIVDKDETNTDILTFTETSGGGTASACSIYCVSFADDGVMGLQNGGMSIRDLGEIDSQPVFRTRIEWYVGLAIKRARAAARLYNIPNLPAIA